MPSNIAAPEAAAHAVLVDEGGRVLIVKPSYKRRWHLPGGYVHAGETPARAAAREAHEELGIEPALSGPVVIAWAPDAGAERILFLHVGELTAELRQAVQIDGAEIIDWTMQPTERLGERLHARMAARVYVAIEASHRGQQWCSCVRRTRCSRRFDG
jgi:8-oxo-dGTP diphosphatase